MKLDVVRLAREAGIEGQEGIISTDEIRHFAALIVEECAKKAEQCGGTASMFATSADARLHNNAVRGCAAAIRQLVQEGK